MLAASTVGFLSPISCSCKEFVFLSGFNKEDTLN